MVRVIKCKKEEFEQRIEDKDIVCFGAGDELCKICIDYEKISGKIKYIVDNNKAGQEWKIGKHVVPIVRPQEIHPQILNCMLIISTISYADQIIQQLDSFEDYDGVDVYVPHFFYSIIDEEQEIIEGNEIIPRKIHYCWFGGDKMPDQFIKNIETWKKFCPDYEIVRWDESNYDITKNKYMYEAYRARKWGFVPDYARLDIINKNGGIYLDTDVEILKSWDPLLKHKLFCGFESTEYVAFGLGFGGVKNNPILKEMMEQYKDLDFSREDGSLNLVASPVYQTEILKRHGLVCNGHFQMTNEFAVYPTQFFAPINSVGLGEVSECSYSIHQYAATWLDKETMDKKNRVAQSIAYVRERIVSLQ